MIEVVVTAGGSGLADELLSTLEPVDGDFRLRLVDDLTVAGEARRCRGRTLVIELDTEADLETADLVIDLARNYQGVADRFRPEVPTVSLLERVLGDLPAGLVQSLFGVIREPAVSCHGGVDALAAQVTQLFNGRDPDPAPFGGTLAFNTHQLPMVDVIDRLPQIPALNQATYSLERMLTDQFYTVSASLWMQTHSIDPLMALATGVIESSWAAPDRGRVEDSMPVQVQCEAVAPNWVRLWMTADLERTLWCQDAKDALMRRLA